MGAQAVLMLTFASLWLLAAAWIAALCLVAKGGERHIGEIRDD